MEQILFDKLLLKTAFCCMACDGSIDEVEVGAIRSMCAKKSEFSNFNFEEEINSMVNQLNEGSKNYLSNFFNLLKDTNLSENEELTLIDFAIGTLKANEEIEYLEIKFFKVIRSYLKISNEKILEVFPDIENYIEEDIVTDSYLNKITNQYIESIELPKFENIKLPDNDKQKLI